MRQLLVILMALGLPAAAVADVYPSGLALRLEREFPGEPVPLGTPTVVVARFHCDAPGVLEGFYYSEQYPVWLFVQPIAVRLNGHSVYCVFETGMPGDVQAGTIPYRWVLDEPGTGQSLVLDQGDLLEIYYRMISIRNGGYVPGADGWFGLFDDGQAAIAVSGDDDEAPLLIFGDGTPAGTPMPGRALSPAWPNPFNPSTRLAFTLDVAARLRLDIHDARGRRVRRLAEGSFSAGAHERAWDGRDDAGRDLPAGVYFARLVCEDGWSRTARLVMIK
ncbi:MAG: hypothetical protein JW819_08405 [Candidatus Krumholzibacteriota bacterium]|nr:hypothetical protein [Candidatus Krumholzibacteriota bacterium]